MMSHLIPVFLGYFAIMNPLANTAVFLALTSDMPDAERRSTARRSLLITFAIILTFAVLGKTLFEFFGISLAALRIAGGVIVFLIGFHMLNGESSSLHKAVGEGADDLSVSPLAVPILAGPGTIATTMSFATAGGWTEIAITLTAFAFLCGLTFICFVFAKEIIVVVGQNGLKVVTRLMGLILSVIGVQMLIEGVYGAVKGFSGM